MSSTFKHNKKRNSGLVYEFLVRRMGLSMVDKDPDSYEKALGLIKKYYSSGQPLAKEREAFEVISKSRGLNENTCRRVLAEVKRHVSGLDSKKIEIKKSNLIKEVHYSFGQDFFDVHRIPQYRLFASIQMLIEQYKKSTSNNITEGVQKIQLEEGIVKFMMSTPETEQKVIRGEKVDSLVAAIAMKKFEERYSGSLNENQKKTLRRFMNFSMTGNSEQFNREMSEEKTALLETLKKSSDEKYFREDSVMKQRLNEAADKLNSLKDLTSESSVQEILLYQKLVQEMTSDE